MNGKKIILSCLLIYSFTDGFCQLKNFGTKAIFKPQPYYKFTIYAYYDVVREYGFGVQQQLNNIVSLDYSVYKVYPRGYLYKKIHQWNYYDFEGYGFSLKPKYMFSPLNRLYAGLNFSIENLHHNIIPVEYYNHDIHDSYYETKKSNGYAFTFGILTGNKITCTRFTFEPYVSIGITKTSMKTTIYDNSSNYYHTVKPPYFPYSYKESMIYFYTNIGIKIGFSFKKHKKHVAIDKKFDSVYIPKTIRLNNYFKTANLDIKSLRYAYNKTRKLNYTILQYYKYTYRDTANFYRRVDSLFSNIDRFIVEGNR